MNKKHNKIGGVKYRTSLLIFFILSVTIITLAGIYTNLSLKIVMKDASKMYNSNIELTSIYEKMDDIQIDIENYIRTNSSESLLSYYDYTNELTTYVNSINKKIKYTPQGVKMKNVANMIKYYLKQSDETINEKRGRNIDAYTTGYENTVKENNSITKYIKQIMNSNVIETAEKHIVINEKTQTVSFFNNIFIAVTVLFVIGIIIKFSFQITKPITKLATYAKEISKGNFKIQIPPIKSSGEINVLYNAFDLMAINIKQSFNQLVEKQLLENSLNEQKLNNLKMKNALRESELLALQSQVNPHFIFNTINIGSKIAMMQGDKITCSYLENAADIFRYNLRGLHVDATLRDEIENIKSYMYLLNTRFGDFVKFKLEICDEEGILDFVLPRMTLQPLIENAYIHGISELEVGGTISLKVTQDEKLIYIRIIDDGVGISKEKIAFILDGNPSEKSSVKKGHTTGIGVDNVLKRLRLFYRTNDVMNIICENSQTEFILTLPKNS